MKLNETMMMVAAALLATVSGSAAAQHVKAELKAPSRPPQHDPVKWSKPVTPMAESVSTPNAGMGSTAVFAPSAVPSIGTALLPPVTLSYSGNSPTLLIETSGPNKGVESLIMNDKSLASAVYGQTNGGGGGVTGYNSGTTGPAGKFAITNPNSQQPVVSVTTTGLGPAIVATNTLANFTGRSPAIYAENLNHTRFAVGVLAVGTAVGVQGMTAPEDDIESVGLYGIANKGEGLNAYSYEGTGASIYSQQGTGAYIASAAGYGIYTESSGDATVYAYNNGPTGVAVYAESEYGLAGQFVGDVHIAGTLKVGMTVYSSDKRLKQDVRPIDGRGLLDKIDHLPVTSWDYKSDPTRRHIGPMAQDFHAAFGLNGDDETHIGEVDIAGVSLAAIKELSAQMKIKDQEIAALRSQLATQSRATADLLTMLRHQGMARRQTASLNVGSVNSAD